MEEPIKNIDLKSILETTPTKFMRLGFTDLNGKLLNIDVPASKIDSAFKNGIMFDGSSVCGLSHVSRADLMLKPDIDSLRIWPIPDLDGRTLSGSLFVMCDIKHPDGSNFPGCVRTALKLVEESSKPYVLQIGPEPEFYLLDKDGKPADSGGYFASSDSDKGEVFRRAISSFANRAGIDIEAMHHEVGPGQHEISFKYGPAIKTADSLIILKDLIKRVANINGMKATFMPKPFSNENGSGLHCHQSLIYETPSGWINVFNHNGELSEKGKLYRSGILDNAKALAAICCPSVNSYKRLVRGYEAPVNIGWGEMDRTMLIRVPADNQRIEVRMPDSTSNPYLIFATMLAAGISGIRGETDNHKIANINTENLPSNLSEALYHLSFNSLVQTALGSHILSSFIKEKTNELDEYSRSVSQWEKDRYL